MALLADPFKTRADAPGRRHGSRDQTIVLIQGLWLIPAGAETHAVPVWELATSVDPPGDLGTPAGVPAESRYDDPVERRLIRQCGRQEGSQMSLKGKAVLVSARSRRSTCSSTRSDPCA